MNTDGSFQDGKSGGGGVFNTSRGFEKCSFDVPLVASSAQVAVLLVAIEALNYALAQGVH